MAYVINRPDEAAMQRLLARHPDDATGAVLRLAWLAGLTRDEIVQLTWPDISIEEKTITLTDRSIPLCEEVERCVLARMEQHGKAAPYVVISDKYRDVLQPESVSRLARKALDSEGMKSVRLTDLRHDFIIRQLEDHDWPYVARISGLAVRTFQSIYAEYIPQKTEPKPQEKGADEYTLWRILQDNRDTAIGLALWMRWQLNLQLIELVDITWDQVDFENNLLRLPTRTVEITQAIRQMLLEEQDRRGPEDDPHVLLTPKSRKPMDMSGLSKGMRTLLIRGGIENVTFRNIHRVTKKDVEKMKILTMVKSKNGITRSDVMELLGISENAAYWRLREMARNGELVKVCAKYYPPETTLAPEEQESAVLAYLAENGVAVLDDMVALLGLERRQCARVMKRLADEGKILYEGRVYRPLPYGTQKKTT